MSNTPFTIADIAREAGVGTATVDRVLNQRPGVNPETAARVKRVIAELGSTVQRGRPRKQGNLRFAYVLPEEKTEFVEMVARQIAQAASDFRHQHITEVTYRLPASEPAKFAKGLAELKDCHGLVVMAPDSPIIKAEINQLVRQGIPVVTLFSDMPGSMRHAYCGADNRAAGRTAGLLMGRMQFSQGRDQLLCLAQSSRLTAQSERCAGFTQIVEEKFNKLSATTLSDLTGKGEDIEEAIIEFIERHSLKRRLAGIYSPGLSAESIVSALHRMKLAGAVTCIAHDLSLAHRSLLISGELNYVLNQDSYYGITLSARVLREICEHVRGALNFTRPRTEIITVENLD